MSKKPAKEESNKPAPAKPRGGARMNIIERDLKNLTKQVGEVVTVVSDLSKVLANPATPPVPPQPAPAGLPSIPEQAPNAAMEPAPAGMTWQGGVEGVQPAFIQPGASGGMVEVSPPRDFVAVKNQILGEDFGMKVEEFSDRSELMVHIIVPEDKSNVPPERRTEVKHDIRSKVVKVSEGANGVAAFCQSIRGNLLASMQQARPSVIDMANQAPLK